MYWPKHFLNYSLSTSGLGCFEWSGQIVRVTMEEVDDLEHPLHIKNNGFPFENLVAWNTMALTSQHFSMKALKKILEATQARRFGMDKIEEIIERYPALYELCWKPESHKSLKWLVRDLSRIPLWYEAHGYLLEQGYGDKYAAR